MKRINVTLREEGSEKTWTEVWQGLSVQKLQDGEEASHIDYVLEVWNEESKQKRVLVSYSVEKIKESKAELIVDAIVRDLSDRRGLRHEWDKIDDDIKEEIIAVWCELTEEILDAP